MANNFPDFTIQELLAENLYSVPRYQRNYAWTEEQIKQLIDDVLDNCQQDAEDVQPYYLGTLVVFPKKDAKEGLIYEVIDGQQRLTTLTLLASYLTFDDRGKPEEPHWYADINLGFSSRQRSSETLKAAHNGNFHDNGHHNNSRHSYAEEIVDAYEIIQRVLPQRCGEKGIDIQHFKKYFFKYVRICRVSVPEDTDLNHYFEIMNNRGEQLEKHEVLKARLLEKLPEGTDQYVFNKIWEACSSMERYVQYGFSKSIRESLFGKNWNKLEPSSAIELFNLLALQYNGEATNGNNGLGLTLDKLILNNQLESISNEGNNKDLEDEPERFSSIINFQNFLPHVLSIFLNDGSVALDDKQLLDSFGLLLNRDSNTIKEFGYALLKIRFLFDQYVIKRDAREDEREWSLKELHMTDQGNPSYRQSFSSTENSQRKISLLQSMFHVSVPSRPYKYWLQGTLRYLYHRSEISAIRFQTYLKRQAKAFVYNRFLASAPLDYDDLIFLNQGKPISSDIDYGKTRYGSVENILLFNYIDFLLWEKHKDEDSKIRDFVFTFRSSVEHYYPQNPIDGNALKDEEVLHSVGNLCLISHSKNSMLRHHLPKAKAEYYLKQPHIDSILQHKMLKDADKWSENPIETIKQQERAIFELIETNQP